MHKSWHADASHDLYKNNEHIVNHTLCQPRKERKSKSDSDGLGLDQQTNQETCPSRHVDPEIRAEFQK